MKRNNMRNAIRAAVLIAPYMTMQAPSHAEIMEHLCGTLGYVDVSIWVGADGVLSQDGTLVYVDTSEAAEEGQLKDIKVQRLDDGQRALGTNEGLAEVIRTVRDFREDLESETPPHVAVANLSATKTIISETI